MGTILTVPEIGPSLIQFPVVRLVLDCNVPGKVVVMSRLPPAPPTMDKIGTGVPIIYRLNADATVASKLDLAA